MPKIIMHNMVSLDDSTTGFDVNMELHYGIARRYGADVHLIGSATAKLGSEMYGPIPPEKETDLKKPTGKDKMPIWAMIDSKGILKGILHTCRSFEFCRDVVVFISEKTPKEYVEYLKERDYDHFVVGEERVDLQKAIDILADKYGAKTIMTDTGATLNNLLIDMKLMDEISVVVAPTLVGKGCTGLFAKLQKAVDLKLLKSEINGDSVLLHYKILRKN